MEVDLEHTCDMLMIMMMIMVIMIIMMIMIFIAVTQSILKLGPPDFAWK